MHGSSANVLFADVANTPVPMRRAGERGRCSSARRGPASCSSCIVVWLGRGRRRSIPRPASAEDLSTYPPARGRPAHARTCAGLPGPAAPGRGGPAGKKTIGLARGRTAARAVVRGLGEQVRQDRPRSVRIWPAQLSQAGLRPDVPPPHPPARAGRRGVAVDPPGRAGPGGRAGPPPRTGRAGREGQQDQSRHPPGDRVGRGGPGAVKEDGTGQAGKPGLHRRPARGTCSGRELSWRSGRGVGKLNRCRPESFATRGSCGGSAGHTPGSEHPGRGSARLPELLRRPARPALAEAAQRRLRLPRRPRRRRALGRPARRAARRPATRSQAGGAAAFRDVDPGRGRPRPRRRGAAGLPRATTPTCSPTSTTRELFSPFFLARVFEAVPGQRRPRRGRRRPSADASSPGSTTSSAIGPSPCWRPGRRASPTTTSATGPLPLFLRGRGRRLRAATTTLVERALEILARDRPGPARRGASSTSTCSTSWPSTCAPTTTATRSTAGPTTSSASGTRTTSTTRAATAATSSARSRSTPCWTASRHAGDARPRPSASSRRRRCWPAPSSWRPASAAAARRPTTRRPRWPTLLPRIARYRDAFYEQLLEHARRRRTPTGCARSRRRRASRSAAPGSTSTPTSPATAPRSCSSATWRCCSPRWATPRPAATRPRRIPAVSVRLLSEILGRLTQRPASRSTTAELRRGGRALAGGRGPAAARHRLRRLRRPVEHPRLPGAVPAVAGPRGQPSATRASTNWCRSVEQTFDLYARLMSEAAAAGDGGAGRAAGGGHGAAGGVVGPLRHRRGQRRAPRPRRRGGGVGARTSPRPWPRWHERGEAAADLAFWRDQLDDFRSPKAFALVVDALLRKGDYRAALALLTNWLGQAEQVPLEDGDLFVPRPRPALDARR